MTKIIVATENRGKLEELAALLPSSVQLLSLSDVGLSAPTETGTTFLENAELKATAAARAGWAAIADDSGLEVDALGGAPGVYSARYAGADATDGENNQKLLEALRGMPAEARSAQFVSVVVAALPDGSTLHATGTVRGKIIGAPRGDSGFGYDPIFEIDDPDAEEFNGRTLAELTIQDKNSISHRARAYQSLLDALSKHPTIYSALFDTVRQSGSQRRDPTE